MRMNKKIRNKKCPTKTPLLTPLGPCCDVHNDGITVQAGSRLGGSEGGAAVSTGTGESGGGGTGSGGATLGGHPARYHW